MFHINFHEYVNETSGIYYRRDKGLCSSNKLATCSLLKGYKLLRYEYLCRYIPLIFKYFSQNAHGVINIHEYYNMLILKYDHLLNILLFKTKFGTLGHLAIEILLYLSVHPLDFPTIFHLFILF